MDLCSEAAASATSDVIIAVPRLAETSHGWLTSPGYPALSNRLTIYNKLMLLFN